MYKNMLSEENQNLENITKEKPVSAGAEGEVFESEPVAVGEDIPAENLGVEKNEEVLGEDFLALPKNPPVEKSKIAGEKIEKIPQAENLPPVEIQEVENAKAQTPAQKILAQPQTKIVEKIKKKITPQGRTSSVVPLRSTSPRGTTFSRDFIQKLLIKARAKIQERKRKKLDKIMALFETKTELSNSDVRKLLRTARRSAVRYLDILEKEQKITQVGKAGRGVKYVRI